MHTINLDLKHGSVSVDSEPIELDETNVIAGPIAKLCSSPIYITQGQARYHFLRKVSVCGKSANCVIEIGEGRSFSVAFLFDLIEFFEFNVLESKILKACEKSSNVKFASNHPSTAVLDSCEWGQARFFYDAKQGDLSLDISFERPPKEPNLKE